MLCKNSSSKYQCCVYHHAIQETIALALKARVSLCPPTNSSLAGCGKASKSFLLCGWTNSQAFLSLVEGVQLQPTGLHPGNDLSQARQKAGDGVNCLWYHDNVQQHVAGATNATSCLRKMLSKMTWDTPTPKKALLGRQTKSPITTVLELLSFSDRNGKHHPKTFLQLSSKKAASKPAVVTAAVDPATGP